MSIDFSKPLQTKSGHKVKILSRDKKDNDMTVVGLIDNYGVRETVWEWTKDGKSNPSGYESDYDLMNIPDKKIIQIYYNKITDSFFIRVFNDPTEIIEIYDIDNILVKTIEVEV